MCVAHIMNSKGQYAINGPVKWP